MKEKQLKIFKNKDKVSIAKHLNEIQTTITSFSL